MNKVWMITGAGRGLGRAFAAEAVKNGDSVIAAARRVDPEDTLFADPRVLTVRMDVTKPQEVQSGVRQGLERFGRIDVLVNNAGFGLNGSLEEVTEEELRFLFETDYYGVIRVLKAVLPAMRRQGSGRILNISSRAGLVGEAGCTPYNAAKFAVVGLSQGLREELAPFGIQVTAVCPGAFRTDFRDGSSAQRPRHPMAEYDGNPAHRVLDFLRENNHKQPGDPAKAAAFLYRVAQSDRMPEILTVGKDCSDLVRTHLLKTLGEIDAWYDASAATARDEEEG